MKRLFITLTLTLLAFMANAQSCPDNNHPHAIDLGLPSGTKWACCNVGATAPEGRGSYYAWGETEEKEKYEWTNYTHCDGSIDTCHDLGSDIAGTEYDVAHVRWGGSWVMPSQDQIKELTSNCSCKWTRINDVSGNLFTGPNGNTIFLPEAGFSSKEGKQKETDQIPPSSYCWSSTPRQSYKSVASYLLVSYGNASWDHYNELCMGLTVRPVVSEAVKETAYRPFIEEGKVWRTGTTFPNISFSHLYDYHIQGDTIIDHHVCKKLMRSELQYPQNYPAHIDTTYAASLYEEGQRVYVVLPGESHLELAYDFASPVGSHIDIDGFNIIVTRKEEKATGCFKGRCTYVGLEEEYEDISFESCWIEGVGVALNPLYSLNELLPTGLLKELLIFCFVNDEVLYYNSDIFDGDIYGLTPQAGEVKKHWIDFTHIKKPRPKAPARERTANETDEENLTGEYSDHELFVNLKILSGAYTVTLKDAADNVVYRKEVQTSSTIALNTDLTKYPEGTYTLVVENSEEQYTATLTLPLDDTAVRDLPSIVNCKLSNCKWYDLSGRQLSTPPAKGIYIRDGKKVVR